MLGIENSACSEFGAPELSLQTLAGEVDLEADVDLDLGDEDELEIKGQVGFEGGAGTRGPIDVVVGLEGGGGG